MINADFQFYNIKQCGYYRRGENETPEFGDMLTTLLDLKAWVESGREFGDTATYTISDDKEPQHTSLRESYCFDLEYSKESNQFLLVLWIGVNTGFSQLQSAKRAGKVGKVVVKDVQGLSEEDIPGFPVYFWILPKENIFASIRINKSPFTGQREMAEYFRGFLNQYGRYVHKERTESPEFDRAFNLNYKNLRNDSKVDAIDDQEKNNKIDTVRIIPKYKTELRLKPSERNWLVSNHHRIEKIIRKTTLDMGLDVNLNLFKRFVSSKMSAYPKDLVDTRFETDVKVHLLKTDVETIIDEFHEEASTPWDNLAFKLSGAKELYHLKDSRVKTLVNLELTPKKNKAFSASELLSEIVKENNYLVKAFSIKSEDGGD